MLETLNTIACAALLVLTFPVAVAMNNSGHWPQRVTLGMVVVMLGLQVVSPFYEWLPPPNAIQAIFNVLLSLVVFSARAEIMALVRVTVGKPPEVTHQLRRAQDISEAQLSRAHGKGIEQ